MEKIENDGKEYYIVPVESVKRHKRVVNELKEKFRNAMMYPDLNASYPLDLLMFALKDLLGNKWNEYALTLKAEVLDSLTNEPRVDLEDSERPYTIDEYFNDILPQYMREEVIKDFFGGDL